MPVLNKFGLHARTQINSLLPQCPAVYANTPARIDGRPVNVLVQNRETEAVLLAAPNSARNTAVNTPAGTEMAPPFATITNVPMMALPKPPPDSNAVGGSSVNSCSDSFFPPRQTSITRTLNSGTHATTVAMPGKSCIDQRQFPAFTHDIPIERSGIESKNIR
jgi:hypothetical protein